MGLFDLFRRGRGKANAPQQSRIDHLLRINHDFLDRKEKAYDGGNFLQLVEQQLERGESHLALWNIATQVKYCFQLANLYWGQGDLATAEGWLRKTLERHQRLVDASVALGQPRGSYSEIEYAKCAAVLLGIAVEDLSQPESFETCYEPWFKNELLSYCLGTHPFDMSAWQAAEDAWRRKRHPKYRMEEFAVYAKALTGQYPSTDAMLAEHQAMAAGRAKRDPDSGLLDGYRDNELIIDYIFAAILKRIGWEGTYRHSWPHTDRHGTGWTTTRHPDRYLDIIAAPAAAPDPDTGIIADPIAARRFIDAHVPDQRDDQGEPVDARRPAKDKGKVAAALKALGWTRDPAALELMRDYRMDLILNDRTHITLCDPLARASSSLADWTGLFHDEFGLHPDFIAIAASEDGPDWRDPQGAWYVLWKKDRRVYTVDRDDWHDPEAATGEAQVGLNLWPSYVSFVAWWVGEHFRKPA